MNEAQRSVPFSITLMMLMALIVLPLATALLWLGWRAVDHLETRSVGQRMASLETAVEGFLTSGLRVTVAVCTTLAEAPSFWADAGPNADEEALEAAGGAGVAAGAGAAAGWGAGASAGAAGAACSGGATGPAGATCPEASATAADRTGSPRTPAPRNNSTSAMRSAFISRTPLPSVGTRAE